MKKIKLIFLITFIGIISVFSQTPQAFKYQAISRDNAGDPIVNQPISVRLSILSGSVGGTVVYSEQHNVSTNNLGLFNVEVGNPTSVLSGIFNAIPWGANEYFLKIEIDPSGGSNFQFMGTSQLNSVPYALYSENTAHPEDADADPGNEIQTLSIVGTNLTLSNGGGTVAIPNGLWNANESNIYYDNGSVGIGLETALAPLHVAENDIVLFGADILGKTNYYPDAKMMFLPENGGAFRVGQLNADGSLIGGTGWNYWDPSNVGWASIAIGNNTKATGAGSVALGIRSYAANFGSVALGHLSRTKGNSGIAAGYYTRADAFVSCAVGSCNVGGGNANNWFATDPIFEVGNSLDTNNRSNALTVLKNGRVGINHSNPQAMLDIEQPNQGPGNGVLLNLAGYGHWETSVDAAMDYNFYYNNVLKSYILDTDGTYIQVSDQKMKQNINPLEPVLIKVLQLKPSTYQYINNKAGSPFSTGFIAQEVEPLFPNQVCEKDGIKALKYSELGVIAIKAIQEQQAIIDAQQIQIEKLEARLAGIEKQMKK